MLIVGKGCFTYNRKKTELTRNENRMLSFLLNTTKSGRNYDAMVDYIWGDKKCIVSINTVSQLAYRLRSKLKGSHIPLTIKISKYEGPFLKPKRKMVIIKRTERFYRWKFYYIR
ncbi:helix-turn-helix domain-containing protein [Rosenbergiella sp. S61]|uniref:Helix-turn-helix domain-containing protein n=1 Tax=Rosenbergiella gaditana TaxID=2726987 RepID=A0ABS5SXS6_9GAMM|nr:helix-turn-helix domain-containing protein [Rosenbergiella gaditana]